MDCIDIQNKHDCCGCGACADACPKSCIKMDTDTEGFIYPVVNHSQCVTCGKCKTVCPIIDAEKANNEIVDDIAYAYVAPDDETVKSSTSGGAFSLIMDAFFAAYPNSAIVGAAFDKTEVKHIAVNNRASANIFRKSKYVQSQTCGIFQQVKAMLTENKTVLFSGTPCQVAALKRYLGCDYDNLLMVDIVCHGVPSQACFDEYLQELETKKQSKVIAAEFRCKKNFNGDNPNPRTINVFFEKGDCDNMDISESEFLYAYYTGMISRPSCQTCKFANPSRPGDITLGDYWGIEKMHPELNSLKGVSLVRFNTEKGKFLIDYFNQSGKFVDTSWAFACAENHQLSFSAIPHRNRNKFFKLRSKGVSFCENVEKCKKPDTLLRKVIRKICTFIHVKNV